jgi:hypothetical protein
MIGVKVITRRETDGFQFCLGTGRVAIATQRERHTPSAWEASHISLYHCVSVLGFRMQVFFVQNTVVFDYSHRASNMKKS